MAYYKDLKSLFAAMQKDMHEVMADEVYETVVEVQQEEIVREVYDAYEPYQYERRGENGGLLDKNNNRATFFTVNGGMQMLVQNVTKGQDNGRYITPLIVGGDGAYGMEYDYKTNRDGTSWKYLQERDFISSTMRRLERTLEAHEAMRRGLAKRGYNFYK